MRVFITGGAGFIGSHLADAAIARGDEVLVLDDMSTGRIENIGHLTGHSRFHFTAGSVRDQGVVDDLVDRCDVVFHLAAAVGVNLVVHSPVRTIETNVHGTEVVLAAAARQRKRVLLTSTSEVYGLSQDVPFREDANLTLGATTKGRWSYGCSKALDEFLALAYYRERELPVVIVRLFNTVGPRQTGRYGMVIPRLIQQALDQRPLTVHGTGAQTRCFGYVGDVVEAMLRLMDHPGAAGQVFNLGSTEEVSITDLAERIVALAGSSSKIVYVPYTEAYEDGFEDMPRRVPDTSKAKGAVGFRARMPLNDMLKVIIREIRAERAGSADARAFAPVSPEFAS